MWYKTFFHGLPQQAWQAAQTVEQTQLDLDLIIESLEFGPGDAVLDIFCGYGRHALPLARMGAQVTGVDISADYIDALKIEAAAKKLPLEAICDDFLTTQALNTRTGQFDAAYCLGNSFAFFPHDDMRRFLQRIADLLHPDGRLLVQSGLVAEVVLPDFQERSWMPIGNELTVLIENEYDPLESRIEQRLSYYRNVPGRAVELEQRTAQYYVYTLAELTRMLAQVGLVVEAVYGTVDGQPFMVGDEGAWLVCTRE
ncbi:MAG: class I SAM-dependent methyltransferase [Cytophagales bacterium]|nr:MAG: class I SAM-dependent methyltransferase [Cytophagales bacterium]